jgi:glycosyltransferase involved in cell wall biosynthesis
VRIAQVAPLYAPVPPPLYGGTERVVSWLTEELVRRGHAVTLFASGDSRTSARLVAPWPRAVWRDPGRPDALALHVLELGQLGERAGDFDVVHCHLDVLALPFGRLLPAPCVHTMHGRLDLPHLAPLFASFRDVPLVSISDSQRAPLADLALGWIATVPHGLPVERVPFRAAAGGRSLVFLGRISPEKRPDLAIAVARTLGLPLRMAARVDDVDRGYFEREIRPLLDHPSIEFVGEVSDEEKWQLLGDALCLLFPIDWPEPFGIALIEALACGTPVVARPGGAVGEIVRDGEVGFVADTVEELVAAVKRVDLLDRVRCRRYVEEHFSVQVMADRYEAVYRDVVARRARDRRGT